MLSGGAAGPGPHRVTVDPGVPAADAGLLAADRAALAAARPAQPRAFMLLPAAPAARVAVLRGARTGLGAATFTAVCSAAPWAAGLAEGAAPPAWLAGLGQRGLYAAGLIAFAALVTAAARIVAHDGMNWTGRALMETVRRHEGRYVTAADLDEPSGALLGRAQSAVDEVMRSRVLADGMLDQTVAAATLPDQEWAIAADLRDLTRLRRDLRDVLTGLPGGDSGLAREDAGEERLAVLGITSRVEALERLAAEVRGAESAYARWRAGEALGGIGRRRRDLLARTGADEHRIADIDALTRQAEAVLLTFPAQDPPAGRAACSRGTALERPQAHRGRPPAAGS